MQARILQEKRDEIDERYAFYNLGGEHEDDKAFYRILLDSCDNGNKISCKRDPWRGQQQNATIFPEPLLCLAHLLTIGGRDEPSNPVFAYDVAHDSAEERSYDNDR